MTEILFLAHRIPYPPDKGDKIRSWHMLRHLAKNATVHLGAFVDDPEDMKHAGALREVCGDMLLQPLRPSGRYVRALRGIAKGHPVSVALLDDPSMRDWVRALLKRRRVDGIFAFSGQMAPYMLPYTAGRRTVMDLVDLDSEKFRQYGRAARGPRRWLYQREGKSLLAFEKHVSRHVDATLFVSAAEAALFRRLAGSYAHDVHGVSNGVDLDYFSPEAAVTPQPLGGDPALVFTGAMDYRPNIDAVRWFADAVWPAVKAALPGASFTIVGSKPAAEVKALARRDGIAVTGRVPDVRPYIAGATLVVAPLRIARGIQNKVLEAMAMAKPVVATAAALEGIEATPGEHLLVADTPDHMAGAVIGLAKDPPRRAEIGAAARRRVVAGYDWATNLALVDTLLGLAPREPARKAG